MFFWGGWAWQNENRLTRLILCKLKSVLNVQIVERLVKEVEVRLGYVEVNPGNVEALTFKVEGQDKKVEQFKNDQTLQLKIVSETEENAKPDIMGSK
ncbi:MULTISPECIES: hypothetical protein [Bacillaceae]|uniref:hypothetical protein n=1 Tax=Bacillaceae TaxID=186817 RepID=UPI0001E895A6|nr:hypothetical protein [Bacillus sp. m3-13]